MPLKSGGFSFLGLVYHTVFTHKEYGNKYVGLRHDSNCMATLIIIFISTHDMADANLCQEYRAFWGMTSGKSFKVTSNLLWKVLWLIACSCA